ncbi:multidrug resistance protein MdtA [Oxobacter pfennigii]|uniref:Multidrug resistance protein MdtA n=1 Tax=Oxobacter pfennigii TaxID=36849 RepID=A0A0P8WAP5_9CLOT|nr:HlyD family efflux transporter periplasmic adaptor subunit [Oxobacter pfennigii]KPU44790.1 multidrug resistance protein MdtA [Oxobacter pfennigii]
MKKRRTITGVIIWSVLGLLTAAFVLNRIFMPRSTLYTEIKASTGGLETYYSFPGSIEVKNKETVLSDRNMQIKSIKVKEGDRVSENTVLLTATMGADIKSKIAGEITSIYVQENSQLMAGSKLIDIVDYSDLQLVIQVDEYDLAAISKDKETTVTIHALNRDVTGIITDISKEGEYLNGVANFTALISLPAENDLRVGMSAEAKVLNKKVSNAILLPISSIQFDADNNPYVLLKDMDNNPKKTSVNIGMNDGVQAEIKSGISENDTILLPYQTKMAEFEQSPIQQNRSRYLQGP